MRSFPSNAVVVAVATTLMSVQAVAAGQAVTKPADPAAVIAELGAFDLSARTDAARTIRRWPREDAVPRLVTAVRSKGDEYVRYSALVLLSGFGGDEMNGVVRDVVTDPNDRLRAVAYGWLEHHPDAAAVPALLNALETEHSEFVRPALIRALAADDADRRVSGVLLPLVTTGDNVFRAAAIRALGDYHATYAAPAIARVATTAGPLEDEAIEAVGKIGDRSIVPAMAALESSQPPERRPIVAAALCLLGSDADRQQQFIVDMLQASLTDVDGAREAETQSAAHALAVLAIAGRTGALDDLFHAGEAATDPARAPIALAAGLVALRTPLAVLAAVERSADQVAAIALEHDAFDMLSEEDFERECFYAAVRHAYWTSADGSATRRTAEALINGLDF